MTFYSIFTKLCSFYYKAFYKIEINGIEHIPTQGKVVICSNHVGLADPILLGTIIPRKLNYMAKKELFENKFLAFWIKKLGAFPVDRDNPGLGAIKKAINILKKDEVFAIFPEGRRVQNEDGESVKPGIAMISIKSKSPIVPIHIDTDYRLFHTIKINIGSPINFEECFDKKMSNEDYIEVSKKILKSIYKLKNRK